MCFCLSATHDCFKLLQLCKITTFIVIFFGQNDALYTLEGSSFTEKIWNNDQNDILEVYLLAGACLSAKYHDRKNTFYKYYVCINQTKP